MIQLSCYITTENAVLIFTQKMQLNGHKIFAPLMSTAQLRQVHITPLAPTTYIALDISDWHDRPCRPYLADQILHPAPAIKNK